MNHKSSSKESPHKSNSMILPFLIEYFEYILAFIIIVECNSLFGNSVPEAGNVSPILFLFSGVGTVSLLVFLSFLYDRNRWHNLPELLLFPFLVFVYSLIFFILNVRRSADSYAQKTYLITFAVLLPLLCVLFRMERKEGRTAALFLKHADLMTVLASLSLAVYLMVTFIPDNIYADDLRTRWIGTGNITHLNNYLNLCVLRLTETRSIFGFVIPRNQGWYPESPMFSLALNTALFTELYLRPGSGVSKGRCLLLSLAVFSSQSTLGMMLVLVAWGLKFIFSRDHELRKKIVLPVIAIIAAGCGILLLQKLRITGTTGESSLAIHIEDYKLAFEAFLHRPLLGWGYENSRPIQALMSAHRYSVNRGLSNSVAVVLAQGGLVLGLFCMLPFLLLFLQPPSGSSKQIRLWGVLTFGLYVLVIFNYHILLLAFMAFGYSFLNIKREPDSRKLRFSLTAHENTTAQFGAGLLLPSFDILPAKSGTILAFLAAGCYINNFFWKKLYQLFKLQRLFLGQSTWRIFFLVCVLVFCSLLAGTSVRRYRNTARIREMIPLFSAAAATAVFLIQKNMVYSHIHTFLQLHHRYSDFQETIGIFLIYILILGFCLVLSCVSPLRKRSFVSVLSSLFAAVFCLAAFSCFFKNSVLKSAGISEAEAKFLQGIAESAEGKVYSDVTPSIFHQYIPGISYSESCSTGYAESPDTTVIVSVDNDIRELFSRGFVVSDISGKHILYTNDSGVISFLASNGYKYSHYFPYASNVSLSYAARRNHLDKTNDNIVWVHGAESSMEYGPGWHVEAGEYTATYQLVYTGSTDSHNLIGKIRISHQYGEEIILYRNVFSDEFKDGRLTVEVPFSTGEWDGMEYSFLGEGNFRVGIVSVSIKQTPDYITTAELNGRRQPVREQYFKQDGSAYSFPDGYSMRILQYDRAGNTTGIFYFDEQQKPTIIKKGWAGIHSEYNDKRQRIYECYFGPDQERILLDKGYSAIAMAYDSDNRVIDLQYFDKADSPVAITAGYSGIRTAYDKQGHKISEEYYDKDGNLTPCTSDYARCEWTYNSAGDPIEIQYFDINLAPALTSSGYAKVYYEYNDNHKLIRETYVGADGNLIRLPSGYAVKEQDYDDNGNVIAMRYFGADSKPVLMKNGYFEICRTYNEKHLLTEERYLGTDGDLILIPDGYAVQIIEYDGSGNAIRYRYLGKDQKPVLCLGGYSEMRREYNSRKEIIKESYLGLSGEPAININGFSVIAREFDSTGKVTAQTYLDTELDPVITVWGYAKVHKEYRNGNLFRETFCGTDGNPMYLSSGLSSLQYTYDKDGNTASVTALDKEGRITIRNDGYAIAERIFNNDRRLISESFYSPDHKRVMIRAGYAELRRTYDDQNRVKEESYYNEEGKLISSAAGYAIQEYTYDDNGNIIRYRYYDSDHNPVINKNGYSEMRREYNEKKQVINESYYDTAGKAVNISTGYSMIRQKHDDRGDSISISYCSSEGTPVITSKGYSEIRRIYNLLHKSIKETYYNTSGNIAVLPSGYSVQFTDYDKEGNISSIRYCDTLENPVMCSEGYHEIRRIYNEKRQLLEEQYYDVNGTPVNRTGGYTICRKEYDLFGNVSAQYYYDVKGNQIVH